MRRKTICFILLVFIVIFKISAKNISNSFPEQLSVNKYKELIDSASINPSNDKISSRKFLYGIYLETNHIFLETGKLEYKRISLDAAFQISMLYSEELKYSRSFLILNQIISESKKYRFYDMLSISYGGLGLIYFHTQLYDISYSYFKTGLEIAEFINDQKQIAINKCYLGYIYSIQKKWDIALRYFHESLVVMEKTKNIKGIIIIKSNLASIYLELKMYDEAKDQFLSCINNPLSNSFLWHKCWSYAGLAEFYNLNEKYDSAITTAKIGLQIAEKVQRTEVIIYCNQELIKAYEKTGKLDSALFYYKEYINYYDTLISNNQEFIHEEVSAAEELKSDIFRLKIQQNFQKKLIEKNKTQKVLLLIISILLLIIVIFLLTFIRRRKYIHRLLRDHNNILSLTNEKLKRSEFGLKESNFVKDKFIALLAHDILTPVSSIKVMINALYKDFDSLEKLSVLNSLKKINHEIVKQHELIQNILQWAILRNGHPDFSPKQIDIGIISFRVCTFFEHFAKKKKIQIINNIPEGTFAFADPSMVAAIIRNLLNNAIKFSELDSKILLEREFSNDEVVISVIDYGIGISYEQQNNLFIHHRTHSEKDSNISNEKGTGIGLFLCRDLIELNGGKIFVESKPGEGSKFSFTLKIITDG